MLCVLSMIILMKIVKSYLLHKQMKICHKIVLNVKYCLQDWHNKEVLVNFENRINRLSIILELLSKGYELSTPNLVERFGVTKK